MLSNCKITKVGIGGPLINFFDGCLVGMNFYDGRPDRTPYLPLPCKKIREVLHSTWRLTTDRSVLRLDKPDVNNKCRRLLWSLSTSRARGGRQTQCC
ncbi:hypothetical protein ZWY2020_021058, partial [Hordeum vulgare]